LLLPPTFNTDLADVATAIAGELDEQTTHEHHLSTNINLAWQKMNEYYAHLDDTPAYVAAVVLHPHMKWRYLEKRWSDKTCSHKQPCSRRQCNNWLQKAKNQFNELCVKYQFAKATYSEPSKREHVASSQSPPAKRQKRASDWLTDDELSDEEDSAMSIDLQLAEYVREPRRADITIDDSPIPYWLHHRSRWPQLAAMALDIYSAAVMSDEPERVFSMTGAAIDPRRRLLEDDSIRNIMCLKTWLKAGVVKLDRYIAIVTSLCVITNYSNRLLFSRLPITSEPSSKPSQPRLPPPAQDNAFSDIVLVE
jgi:hypothetical protein